MFEYWTRTVPVQVPGVIPVVFTLTVRTFGVLRGLCWAMAESQLAAPQLAELLADVVTVKPTGGPEAAKITV